MIKQKDQDLLLNMLQAPIPYLSVSFCSDNKQQLH
jgi:hypothetical protein